MSDTRRSRRLEKKTKRNIILTLLGIIVILFLIFKFGIPLIANFAIFVSGFRSTDETTAKTASFIQSPVLDPLPEATNSARIEITGRSVKDKEVELFVNDSLEDTTTADEKGVFSFNQTLKTGENMIKVRVNDDKKKSDFSPVFTIIYISSAPSLTIDSPADGHEFKKDDKTINVSGKTDSGVSVTVNGFWAIVDEANNYSYMLPLHNGDNEIKIIATDKAGNATEKTIKVKYSE